jgi:5-methylcytosine-specific restriction endonuclease McrA
MAEKLVPAKEWPYHPDYKRCEICLEYWPNSDFGPSAYFPLGRRECLHCHPGPEIKYYYTVCTKCGTAWWCKYDINPWLCYGCKNPKINEMRAKEQTDRYEERKKQALEHLPAGIKADTPESWEFRWKYQWEYKRFHKSGKTLDKEEKYSRRKMQMRMARANRAARLAGVPTNYTWDLWMAKVDFYEWRCVYCGIELTLKANEKNRLTCDHFVAIKNGGTHYISNLLPACKSCNSRKGAKKGWKIKFRGTSTLVST